MSDIIAYKLNGEIVDTQSIAGRESSAEPIYFDNSKEALHVIRHSCAHSWHKLSNHSIQRRNSLSDQT